MYTSLYSNSPHIHVNDKQSSSYNFSPVSLLPNVRYNSEINKMEALQNGSWTAIPEKHYDIQISAHTDALLNYVAKQMAEEQKITELAKNNNAVSIAVENFNRAKSQLKTTIALVENNSIV